jgi:hypothetical protein
MRAFQGFYGFNSYHMGETRHTAPSLRLFRPEQPNGVSPFLSSVGCACNVTFLWLGSFCSDHSPTVTSTPFLDQLVLSGFADKLPVSPGYHNHPNSSSLLSLPTQSS